ncbi:MAG: hypothetical protein GX790_01350 [Syntrophomonadaceae bacterium]|nr:hypothetical protein [Syntrophomonadaceae bacterium]
MNNNRGPIIRLFVLVLIIGMIFSMPLREYIKITAFFGIPFIFILGFMLKKERYSIPWFISAFLLLLTIIGYGFMLNTLPDRIEVKNIMKTGTTLEGEGNYKGAIEEYKKLEQYGKIKKMEERIASAEKELKGQEIIKEANELIAKGDKAKAEELLKTVPPNTKAAKEANKLLKQLEE